MLKNQIPELEFAVVSMDSIRVMIIGNKCYFHRMSDQSRQLDDLKKFFCGRKIPNEVKLVHAVRIVDVPKFLESNLAILEYNHITRTHWYVYALFVNQYGGLHPLRSNQILR